MRRGAALSLIGSGSDWKDTPDERRHQNVQRNGLTTISPSIRCGFEMRILESSQCSIGEIKTKKRRP